MHRFQKWRAALQLAPTPAAVVGVIHDYIRSLPQETVDALPSDCQLSLAVVESTLDIQRSAVTLLQCELFYSGKPEIVDVLHEIAHTFAAASVRLTSLAGQRPLPVATQ